jgi:CDP-2,3-bis-(O-geranylgeranyl)-sn-glycerol synthase
MTLNLLLVAQLLALLVVANGAPVIAKKILGKTLAFPLDGGSIFIDGKPLFGASKTIRGVVLAIAATIIAGPLVGLDWKVGALVGVMAMAGDLLSSFVKRRMGLAPSSKATGLDQIPESLLPLIAASVLLPLSVLDIAAATALFFFAEIVLSRLLYRLNIRDQPY